MRWILRSKIHKATVTEADVSYVGSITIDQDLMERVGLWPGEKVLVAIPGAGESGVIEMNGAAAHRVRAGEEIIIMGFELTDRPVPPTAILVNADNRFVRELHEGVTAAV
jgi:aspartate 1-decarboxylase